MEKAWKSSKCNPCCELKSLSGYVNTQQQSVPRRYLDGQVFLVGSCCGLLVSETSCEMLGSHVQWRGRRGHEALTFLGYYRPHIRTVMTLPPNSDSAKRWIQEEEDDIILDIFVVWYEATKKFRECLEWTKKTLLRSSWRNSEKVAQLPPKVSKHPIYQPMGGELLYLTAFFFMFFSCRSTIHPDEIWGCHAGCPSHRAGFQLLRMHFGAPVGLECESFWYKPTKKQCFSIVMLVFWVVTIRLCFFYINRNKFKLRLWKIQGEAICLFHNLIHLPKGKGISFHSHHGS